MDEKIKTIANWLGTGSINIFGHPFAGKDTQGRKLAEFFGGEELSGGEIMRSYHDQEKIQQIMATGALLPIDLYLSIVVPYLSKSEYADKPLILSSIGRFHGEEHTIMEATKKAGHPTKAVILLHLNEDEVWHRYEVAKSEQDRGERQDDKREALKTRLQEFNDKTMPVIEYYREKGLLIEVDGTLTREEVTNEILDSLVALTKG